MQSSKENAEEGIPIILLGNKIDLNRQVTTEEAEKVAGSYKIKFFETSAKNNIGISEAIRELASQVLLKEKPSEFKLSLDDENEVKEEGGCGC